MQAGRPRSVGLACISGSQAERLHFRNAGVSTNEFLETPIDFKASEFARSSSVYLLSFDI
ncbi:MAG: hypothetical protein LBP59_09370 [Planctomycetaceae bacterium]|nr:hypothetical protein [Planctomycetaceae bacterium]